MGALSLLAKLRRYDPKSSVEDYLEKEMRQNFKAIEDALSKIPSFQILDVSIGTSSETLIEHGLKTVPIGFAIVGASVFGNVRNGSTAWTNENAYLIADVAGTYRVLLFYVRSSN